MLTVSEKKNIKDWKCLCSWLFMYLKNLMFIRIKMLCWGLCVWNFFFFCNRSISICFKSPTKNTHRCWSRTRAATTAAPMGVGAGPRPLPRTRLQGGLSNAMWCIAVLIKEAFLIAVNPIQEGLRVNLLALYIKWSQLRYYGLLIRTFPRWVFEECPIGRKPPRWLEHLGVPPAELDEVGRGEGSPGVSA